MCHGASTTHWHTGNSSVNLLPLTPAEQNGASGSALGGLGTSQVPAFIHRLASVLQNRSGVDTHRPQGTTTTVKPPTGGGSKPREVQHIHRPLFLEFCINFPGTQHCNSFGIEKWCCQSRFPPIPQDTQYTQMIQMTLLTCCAVPFSFLNVRLAQTYPTWPHCALLLALHCWVGALEAFLATHAHPFFFRKCALWGLKVLVP